MRKRINDMTIATKVTAAVSVVLLTTAVMGAIAYTQVDAIEDSVAATERAYQVVDDTERLIAELADQQAGLRGFLLSGDPAYLEPYRTARSGFESRLASLKARTAADPAQQARLARAGELAERWHGEVADRQIRLMRHPDTVNEARMLEAVGAGSAHTAGVRALAAEVAAAEKERLKASAAAQREAFAFTYRAIEVGVAMVLLLGLAVGLLARRLIARPIVDMTERMRRLADGDKDVAVVGLDRRDEIGAMAHAVEVFKQYAIRADRLAAEQVAEHAAEARRASIMGDLVRRFESTVSGILGTVGSSARQLDTTARDMAEIADLTSRQATASASAAEQTSANVQTVASATEEMAATLREISGQVSRSTDIAGRAVREAEETNATVGALNDAARNIGEVVQLINTIAGQTNLLALNATIEAARAGEAGKGFAVVAQEVKNLANQTARATEEIAAQVSAMQQSTGGVVEAIHSIGRTIAAINEVATTIAGAVEQQTAATNEIARNVQEAARGTDAVTGNVTEVTRAAGRAGDAAKQVLGAADDLGRQSDTLRREVETFLEGIRAA
ncbi:methyl-accepting chemotaxis protein [Azospirillum halopraeferens]|uniref:methyl-accepting chemotaxis protein n=1 Tax=Azospirillum halopraeferens TaxID=34010 RepID=UPI0004199454|nr:methyl-accepting chemotaxis protein [Azospirillum halopraeferens]